MKTIRLFSLLLAGLLAACGAEEPASESPTAAEPAPAVGQIDEGIMVTFDEARLAQNKVLKDTAGLLADAGAASGEAVEYGLLTLNRAIMQSRQAVAILRNQAAPEAKDLIKELRDVNLQVRAAYDELLPWHPDPATLPAMILEDNVSQ